jgi:2,3-bisphosphoglycerate-independent phosphoglycerate mutase
MDHRLIQELVRPADTKIVLLVLDGLGSLPAQPGGLTALETADTPHLDDLAEQGVCGLHEAVRAGITPGSGAGHLGLFGYDPVEFRIGRGVLAALGTGFELKRNDVAARGNFCTLDEGRNVVDRRAGRIPTDKNEQLCELLREIELPGVELFVEPVKEHRFLLVLRGEGLSDEVSDTDPQATRREPLEPKPRGSKASRTAELVGQFVRQARDRLAEREPANMVLLRGFAELPDWPSFKEVYGLKAAAIASYPMYLGVAKLLGMKTVDTGPRFEEKLAVLGQQWGEFDFFFVHVKQTDSSGEDEDFARKVREIEQVDDALPQLLDLRPDVVVVTGDHSTPAVLGTHSWHPVPVVVWSKHCRSDPVKQFGERACTAGGLGPRFPATDLMPLALANALRLRKFGA